MTTQLNQFEEIYTGAFKRKEDIAEQFNVPIESLEGLLIIQASYDCSSWEGNADVLFIRDNKMYEVHAYHCSCYDLAGKWEEEETFPEAAVQQTCFEQNEFLKYLVANPGLIQMHDSDNPTLSM